MSKKRWAVIGSIIVALAVLAVVVITQSTNPKLGYVKYDEKGQLATMTGAHQGAIHAAARERQLAHGTPTNVQRPSPYRSRCAGCVSLPSTTVGSVLHASTGTWTGTPTAYTYAWQDCNSTASTCTTITGATATTYTIQSADVGFYIRVVVVAANAYGSAFQVSAITTIITGSYTCNKYASPSSGSPAGSDSNPGTASSPYLTVGHLQASLTSGQTGCLLAGVYGSQTTPTNMTVNSITLTAAPGATATIDGYFDANANGDTISRLHFNESSTYAPATLQSGCAQGYDGVVVTADNNIFDHDEFYYDGTTVKQTGIGVGWWGTANGTIIRYSKIHDVGSCRMFDHGIYLGHGNNVQIYDNWIWNVPHGWGVQVYPGPTNAIIHSNVIDAAGSGFTVGGSAASNDQITNNVVMNSTGLVDAGTTGAGVTTCCSPGTGNVFNNNDVFNNPAGVGGGPGITLSGNITTDPNLPGAGSHNYAPSGSSPAYGLWDGT